MAVVRSIPNWPEPIGGTLLIVGSAPCVYDDLAHARSIRPEHHTLLINGAALLFEHAEHILCGHGEKVAMFVEARHAKFPNAKPCYIHASRRGGTDPKGVTHIWENVATGGTSAWKAVRIARGMGYDEMILCGCPLDDSGYAPGESDGIKHSCDRIGLGEGRMYHNYRHTFSVRAKTEGAGVYSMSGFSRELLGAPA